MRFLCFAQTYSLYHTVEFVFRTVKYVSHSVVFISHTVEQRNLLGERH